MGRERKEKIYVTYTCKKCKHAFVDVDPYNDINDEPLITKYCPDCLKKGYKNIPSKQELIKKYVAEKLIENNITDKKDISFVKRYVKKTIDLREKNNQRVQIAPIFKNALEVLGYRKEKQS